VRDQLVGHVVSLDEGLGQQLRSFSDAELLRHAYVMRHELEEINGPELHDGYHFFPVDSESAEEIALAADLAYPIEHPDHRPDQHATEVAIIRGEEVGQLLEISALVRGQQNQVIAACAITDFSGAWIADLFRIPSAPSGTGAALLNHTLRNAREAGTGSLGLAVTASNAPALKTYLRAGFAITDRSMTFVIKPRS
jgi:GNAT superfamily N-acetyltransferase